MAQLRDSVQPLTVVEAFDFLCRLEPRDRIYFAAGQNVDYMTRGQPCTVNEVTTVERANSTRITVEVRTFHDAKYQLEVSNPGDRTWSYRIDGGGNRDSRGEIQELEVSGFRYGTRD